MGLKKFLASLFGANSLKEEIKEDSCACQYEM